MHLYISLTYSFLSSSPVYVQTAGYCYLMVHLALICWCGLGRVMLVLIAAHARLECCNRLSSLRFSLNRLILPEVISQSLHIYKFVHTHMHIHTHTEIQLAQVITCKHTVLHSHTVFERELAKGGVA